VAESIIRHAQYRVRGAICNSLSVPSVRVLRAKLHGVVAHNTAILTMSTTTNETSKEHMGQDL
jgi:hypothetical protein